MWKKFIIHIGEKNLQQKHRAVGEFKGTSFVCKKSVRNASFDAMRQKEINYKAFFAPGRKLQFLLPLNYSYC